MISPSQWWHIWQFEVIHLLVLGALLLCSFLSSQQPPQTTGLVWGPTIAGVTLCFMLALMSPFSSVILCARWSWLACHQTHRYLSCKCLGALQDSHSFFMGPLRSRMKQQPCPVTHIWLSMIPAYSEVPISSWNVTSSTKDLADQKLVGQDGVVECTSQQDAFRMPTSILAPAAYIPVIPGQDKNLGSSLSMLSASSENWAKICNGQHSFKLGWAGLYCY